MTGWEVPERPSSQLRQSPSDVTGTLIGLRGQESISLPPQPFFPNHLLDPQRSCPETTRRTRARGISPPQEK